MSRTFAQVVGRIRADLARLAVPRLQVNPRIALSTAVLLVLPLLGSPFHIDLACQVFLACIGALALMLLTGFAGQVSLGHAGLMAAGAFAVGILHKEISAPFWIALPAAATAGAVLGLIFGLPSLRLRGLYLAVSTLALHFVVVYLGGEYEHLRGHSTGIIIDPPQLFGYRIYDGRSWYFVLLAAAALTLVLCRNLLMSRTGRAWGAIHAKETVAAALGINVAYYKLLAFVITSSITAASGALFAYYRNFASVDAFSLYLSIQYVAMIIIGGMGTISGALLGAAFVTIMPYAIESVASYMAGQGQFSSSAFALIYASFGLVMIGFLVLEPRGLIGVARRVKPHWDQKYIRAKQLSSDLLDRQRATSTVIGALRAVQQLWVRGRDSLDQHARLALRVLAHASRQFASSVVHAWSRARLRASSALKNVCSLAARHDSPAVLLGRSRSAIARARSRVRDWSWR